MIVKKLELVNFQAIKEFNADFDGNVYFITGDNELGKSTVLKAIGALLTGNRDAVLRNGESKGFAKMIVASNPTVKVFRIARGESLGEKRLKSIIEIANKNGFQGFIEEVKRGQSELLIEEYTESEQA